MRVESYVLSTAAPRQQQTSIWVTTTMSYPHSSFFLAQRSVEGIFTPTLA